MLARRPWLLTTSCIHLRTLPIRAPIECPAISLLFALSYPFYNCPCSRGHEEGVLWAGGRQTDREAHLRFFARRRIGCRNLLLVDIMPIESALHPISCVPPLPPFIFLFSTLPFSFLGSSLPLIFFFFLFLFDFFPFCSPLLRFEFPRRSQSFLHLSVPSSISF